MDILFRRRIFFRRHSTREISCASIMRAQTIHLSLQRNLLNLYVILIEWLDLAVNLIVLYRIVFAYNRIFSGDSEILKKYRILLRNNGGNLNVENILMNVASFY